MKALTLNQPWAMMVPLKAKQIETRSWSTRYRGRLAIHASKKLTLPELALCYQPPFRDVLTNSGIDIMGGELRPGNHKFPLGAVIATCELVDCIRTDQMRVGGLVAWNRDSSYWSLTNQEKAFGDYSPGRYAWLLDNVQMLPEPIPAKGALGLWEWKQDGDEK